MYFLDNLPEWCTSEFLSLCKERAHAKTRAKKTNNPNDIEIARIKRNNTVNMGKELRKVYFKMPWRVVDKIVKSYGNLYKITW